MFKSLLIILFVVVSCGPTSQSEAKIVGGSQVRLGGQNLTSTVFLADARGQFGCTAVLIGSSQVLTAGHCLQRPGSAAQIGFGDLPSRAVFRQVTFKKMHPKFLHGYMGLKNDIGVVTFAGTVPAGFAPVELATTALTIPLNNPVVISGYGIQQSGQMIPNPPLMSTEVPFRSAGSGIIYLDARNGRGACQGDSGGPAITTIAGKSYLIGVTSTGTSGGRNCGGEYNIYTDVRVYKEWVETSLGIKPSQTEPKPKQAVPNIINRAVALN